MNVRLLFVCGSARKASTAYAIDQAAEAARGIEGVEVDVVYLKGKKINPCIGCNACVKNGSDSCIVYHDDMDEIKASFWDYDGVLMGSPVYDMAITPQLVNFISRFRGEYLNQKDDPMATMYMPGAALAVGGTRNGGQEFAIHAIHGFYHTHGMPIVTGGLGIYAGVSVWSKDRMAEGAAEDVTGIENARYLGKKLALTAKAMKYAKEHKEEL